MLICGSVGRQGTHRLGPDTTWIPALPSHLIHMPLRVQQKMLTSDTWYIKDVERVIWNTMSGRMVSMCT